MASEVKLVEDRFPEIIRELARRMGYTKWLIAQRIADRARVLAPRLKTSLIAESQDRIPGYLASSIEVDKLEGGEQAVMATAFYAHFVEFGTEDTRAEPFMQPAALIEEAPFIEEVREQLGRL